MSMWLTYVFCSFFFFFLLISLTYFLHPCVSSIFYSQCTAEWQPVERFNAVADWCSVIKTANTEKKSLLKTQDWQQARPGQWLDDPQCRHRHVHTSQKQLNHSEPHPQPQTSAVQTQIASRQFCCHMEILSLVVDWKHHMVKCFFMMLMWVMVHLAGLDRPIFRCLLHTPTFEHTYTMQKQMHTSSRTELVSVEKQRYELVVNTVHYHFAFVYMCLCVYWEIHLVLLLLQKWNSFFFVTFFVSLYSGVRMYVFWCQLQWDNSKIFSALVNEMHIFFVSSTHLT